LTEEKKTSQRSKKNAWGKRGEKRGTKKREKVDGKVKHWELARNEKKKKPKTRKKKNKKKKKSS